MEILKRVKKNKKGCCIYYETTYYYKYLPRPAQTIASVEETKNPKKNPKKKKFRQKNKSRLEGLQVRLGNTRGPEGPRVSSYAHGGQAGESFEHSVPKVLLWTGGNFNNQYLKYSTQAWG